MSTNITYAYFRELPCFQAAFLPLVEELRHGYTHGHPVRDSSRFPHQAHAELLLHSILLYIIGDYPGQAKLCNLKHSGQRACHCCMHLFEKTLGKTGGNIAINNRAVLDNDHYMRDDPAYGTIMCTRDL